VVAIGTTLLARSFTLSDQIAALTERTAVTEQKVATLQIDFQDVRNEVRTANDRLTELRLIVGNIAVKLDAMPQHLPPPRKPGEP
jgi:chromosome segregation ATPase